MGKERVKEDGLNDEAGRKQERRRWKNIEGAGWEMKGNPGLGGGKEGEKRWERMRGCCCAMIGASFCTITVATK